MKSLSCHVYISSLFNKFVTYLYFIGYRKFEYMCECILNSVYWFLWLKIHFNYLYLPSIFPIECVGGPSAFMRAWLHRYVNQHSATYIVLLSAYEVVDVNG